MKSYVAHCRDHNTAISAPSSLITQTTQTVLPINQEVPTTLAAGQIHTGVLAAATQNGWLAKLDSQLDVLVPRPYGSKGPVLGDKVHIRLIAINRVTGALVGVLVLPEKRQ